MFRRNLWVFVFVYGAVFAGVGSREGIVRAGEGNVAFSESIPAAVGLEESDSGVALGKNYLWQVKGERGRVYVFGSVHLGRPDFYPLDAAIEAAFDESDVLAVEIDIVHTPQEQLQGPMVARGFYRDGTTLKDHIPEDLYHQLLKIIPRYQLTPQQILFMKPWFLAMSLSVMEIQRLGYEEAYGVDRYFLQRAGPRRIVELESVAEQVHSLEKAAGMDDLFIRYTVLNLKETEAMMDEMIQAWQEGDLSVIEKVAIQDLLDEDPRLAGVLDILLFQRNERMVEKIQGLLRLPRTSFVVVGAAHFPGERGILSLLKKAGYSVEQIPKKD